MSIETKEYININDLDRKIQVDGKQITVRAATAEQFDIFVYSILYQMYPRKGHAHNRYELSFWQHDYSKTTCRLSALGNLRRLNQIRAGSPTFKPAVPLFVEEEQAHV